MFGILNESMTPSLWVFYVLFWETYSFPYLIETPSSKLQRMQFPTDSRKPLKQNNRFHSYTLSFQNRTLAIRHINVMHMNNTNSNNHFARAIFLDIKPAFHRVWPNKLIHQFHSSCVYSHLTQLIVSFSKNTPLQVKSNIATSTMRAITTGVPQGAILFTPSTIFSLRPFQTKLQMFTFWPIWTSRVHIYS